MNAGTWPSILRGGKMEESEKFLYSPLMTLPPDFTFWGTKQMQEENSSNIFKRSKCEWEIPPQQARRIKKNKK